MCHDDLYFLLNVLLPQASSWAREGPLGSPDMTQDSARVLLPPARPSCPSLGWETAPSPLPRVPESPSESSAVWPPLGREGGDHAHTEPDPVGWSTSAIAGQMQGRGPGSERGGR